MTEVKKPVRLSKVAKEFNVGISTIVDFLGDKGIEVDSNPNTKIDGATYGVIRDEFADEKMLKEKSKSVSRSRSERETITLESSKKEKDKPEEEEFEIDLSSFQKSETPEAKKEEAPAPEPEAEKAPEPEPAPEPTPEPEPAPAAEEVKEEPKAEEPAPEVKEEAPTAKEEAPAKEEEKTGPKVVGKVDLDSIAPKKKKPAPKKEKEEKKEAPAEKPAAKKEPAPEAPAEKPAAEEKPATEKKKPEIVRAEAKKLTGPTVVGKIELPVEKPKKKPVASSTDDDLRKKRKRKRISKVDVDKPGQPGGGGNRRGGNQRGGNQRGGNRRGDKPEISDKDIQKEIKETLARLSGGGKSKSSKMRRAKRDAAAERREEEQQRLQEESTILKLTEFVTVSELANMMSTSVNDVISACMSLGIMVSINQRLDGETISIIAEEFGYEAEFVAADVQDAIQEEVDAPEDLLDRPPIITVMGHVDHGKTSLLDHIRKANVIAGEAGGITQHIGAYNVELSTGKTITFLDTPGHEAFTAMRARGAQVTDLAIIVIAADDSVMPQTIEAINHAQAAEIPMVFAFNKIDKPGANADKIREELSTMNILVEDWGGTYQAHEISAKNGVGIDELLEKVLLEAELLELKANPAKRAVGTIIESSLDKGRGYVSTLLVEGGTLRVGDAVLAGQYSGRVKAMFNERGNRIEEAGPSMPVSMLGLSGAAAAGDKFHVLEDEKEARGIAVKRQQLQREQGVRTQRHITIEEIGRRIAIGEFKELNLIVKGDVDGSIEALSDSLQKLSTEKIQVNIIHKAVGQISESDVLLASASDAIVIGFQVRPSAGARKLAETEEIQIRLYSVIYKAIEEMKEAMEGMLSAKIEEKVTGTCEVRETFKISKVGTIAGCFVLDGKLNRNSNVRVIRDGIVIYTGVLGSLKRFKDDVKEVTKGYECGLNVDKFNDIKVGDHIEAYEEVEVKQKL
ncbi:translation initiation factor IF-2 [Sanyastnella coralliicola]|uniref:translation initiation factor IF-2 n=1 Tax=Sanyastnella coralliicola TaxID=3069118 RepID=UPI0027BACA38|nr:translation initiation factor IF-2 [Longitalea sp. SCSIO 12813]